MLQTTSQLELGRYIVSKNLLDVLKEDLSRLKNLVYSIDQTDDVKDTLLSSKYASLLFKDTVIPLSIQGMSEKEKEAFAESISNIEQYCDKVTILVLYLSFIPSDSFVGKVHKFISSQITQDFVIDTKVDRSIIAGLKIEFNGHYIDLSLSKLIDDYFSANKDEILSRI